MPPAPALRLLVPLFALAFAGHAIALELKPVELSGIEKRFPGVIANHDVNLNVRAGTIHAIVGENGAGKSTLMKTLYGMHQPEAISGSWSPSTTGAWPGSLSRLPPACLSLLKASSCRLSITKQQ